MTNKEINIRSIIFLVIGNLLVLSLVICIYIVNSQRDLKAVEAIVTNVKEDKDGTGKNDVTVIYEVDGTSYKYSFYYRDDMRSHSLLQKEKELCVQYSGDSHSL